MCIVENNYTSKHIHHAFFLYTKVLISCMFSMHTSQLYTQLLHIYGLMCMVWVYSCRVYIERTHIHGPMCIVCVYSCRVYMRTQHNMVKQSVDAQMVNYGCK